MSIELRIKKIDDKNSVISDALTTDPVAVVKQVPSMFYGKKKFVAHWHPAIKHMYPEETSSFSHMNLSDADSATQMMSRVNGSYERLMSGKKDPMKTSFVGTVQRQYNNYDAPVEFNHYHVHDDKGEAVASLYVNKELMPYVGDDDTAFRPPQYPEDPNYRHAFVEYHGTQPTEQQHEILTKKNIGYDPITLLRQVKHWHELKDKEPKFVGSHSSSSGNGAHYVYTTKLKPEAAADEYMKHLKGLNGYQNHTFTKVTPTMFIAKKAAPEDRYSSGGSHEVIDTSDEGIVNHMITKIYHKNSSDTKRLNAVIE